MWWTVLQAALGWVLFGTLLPCEEFDAQGWGPIWSSDTAGTASIWIRAINWRACVTTMLYCLSHWWIFYAGKGPWSEKAIDAAWRFGKDVSENRTLDLSCEEKWKRGVLGRDPTRIHRGLKNPLRLGDAFSAAELRAGGWVREEARNIKGARVSKNLDARLRCFGLFSGNSESAEVLNQRSGICFVFLKKTDEL